MTDRRLVITAAVDAAIRRHGEETFPHECCGALIGRDGVVTDVLALPNTTEEGPRRRFLVRPSDYGEAERRAGKLGAELLGFYHSHPDHPARPSQYDLDHAWPTFAYIIVSVIGTGGLSRQSADGTTADAQATDMTVWHLKDDRSSFEEGCLHHAEDTHSDTAQAVHR
jgi:proteasome lid subunit RPN8/RPN11